MNPIKSMVLIFLVATAAGCTTAKISSVKEVGSTNRYDNFVIVAKDSNIDRKKAIEDSFEEKLREENVASKAGYKIFSPLKKYSNDELMDLLLSSGANAVILIERQSVNENTHTFSGYENKSLMDNKGNAYTYAVPTTESYVSSSRNFRASILSMITQKIVWFADVEISTIAPSELRLLTDFRSSAVNKLSSNVVGKMKEDGIFNKINSK